MHLIDKLFILGVVLIILVTLILRSIHTKGVDAYNEWVAEIKALNPGWEEPWLPNGQRNPRWVPGNTIKHADGTTYTFDS